jgi:hypothetical protein
VAQRRLLLDQALEARAARGRRFPHDRMFARTGPER